MEITRGLNGDDFVKNKVSYKFEFKDQNGNKWALIKQFNADDKYIDLKLQIIKDKLIALAVSDDILS